LEHIYSENPNPPAAFDNSTFDGVPVSTCIVHVPVGSKTLYEAADGWKEFFGNIVADIAVGIVETQLITSLVVYPNPTKGELTISLPNPSKGGAYEAIEIYDVMGRLVAPVQLIKSPLSFGEGQGERLNVSHLANGVYYLRMGSETVKFVKE
jgi:hypothetical protein